MSSKNSCMDCSNRVGDSYCTMQKDMDMTKYKACDGFVQVPKKPSLQEKQAKYEKIQEMKRRLAMKSDQAMADENFSSDFLRFLKTGGSWSIREEVRLI